MPANKNKIYTALILCLGIIVSVWLLSKRPTELASQKTEKQNQNSVSVDVLSNLEQATSSNDWQKILVEIDKSQKTINLTKNQSASFDSTTLTAQIARDFFSQYLLAKKGSQAINQTEVNNIVDNTLSMPEYTKPPTPIYVASNLHLSQKNDTLAIKKYFNDFSLILKNDIPNNDNNPISAVTKTLNSKNENDLKKIDPFLTASRKAIADLLSIEVPPVAVKPYLDLINKVSALAEDLVAMKKTLTDPLAGLIGTSQFLVDMPALSQSLANMDDFFYEKIGLRFSSK